MGRLFYVFLPLPLKMLVLALVGDRLLDMTSMLGRDGVAYLRLASRLHCWAVNISSPLVCLPIALWGRTAVYLPFKGRAQGGYDYTHSLIIWPCHCDDLEKKITVKLMNFRLVLWKPSKVCILWLVRPLGWSLKGAGGEVWLTLHVLGSTGGQRSLQWSSALLPMVPSRWDTTSFETCQRQPRLQRTPKRLQGTWTWEAGPKCSIWGSREPGERFSQPPSIYSHPD